jgi:hypothetical protein
MFTVVERLYVPTPPTPVPKEVMVARGSPVTEEETV